MRKIKLMIVTHGLPLGGVGRNITILLRYLDRSLFDVELVMIFNREVFYPIPLEIQTHILERNPLPHVDSIRVDIPIQLLGAREDFIWLELTALKLAELVHQRRPDVVFARELFASTLCLLSRKYWPKEICFVGSVDNHASTMLSHAPKGPLYMFLGREHLQKADKIVCPSEGVASDLMHNFKVTQQQITVIPYPLDLQQIEKLVSEPVDHPWMAECTPIITAAGRLAPQKGFDYLLRALSLVHKQGNLARLILLGEGDEHQRLEDLAAELGIQHCIWFAGKQKNPFKYFARSTVFVLSSLYEGFGYVIAEALACGCPVIATDCPSGPAEILGGGRYGLLVPVADARALAEAITKVLSDPALRQQLAEQGRQRAQDFEARKIVNQYVQVIRDTYGT